MLRDAIVISLSQRAVLLSKVKWTLLCGAQMLSVCLSVCAAGDPINKRLTLLPRIHTALLLHHALRRSPCCSQPHRTHVSSSSSVYFDRRGGRRNLLPHKMMSAESLQLKAGHRAAAAIRWRGVSCMHHVAVAIDILVYAFLHAYTVKQVQPMMMRYSSGSSNFVVPLQWPSDIFRTYFMYVVFVCIRRKKTEVLLHHGCFYWWLISANFFNCGCWKPTCFCMIQCPSHCSHYDDDWSLLRTLTDKPLLNTTHNNSWMRKQTQKLNI